MGDAFPVTLQLWWNWHGATHGFWLLQISIFQWEISLLKFPAIWITLESLHKVSSQNIQFLPGCFLRWIWKPLCMHYFWTNVVAKSYKQTLEMSPYCCLSLDKAIANLLQHKLVVAKARAQMIHVNQQLPAISLWIKDVRPSITSKHLGNAEKLKSFTSYRVPHQIAGQMP